MRIVEVGIILPITGWCRYRGKSFLFARVPIFEGFFLPYILCIEFAIQGKRAKRSFCLIVIIMLSRTSRPFFQLSIAPTLPYHPKNTSLLN